MIQDGIPELETAVAKAKLDLEAAITKATAAEIAVRAAEGALSLAQYRLKEALTILKPMGNPVLNPMKEENIPAKPAITTESTGLLFEIPQSGPGDQA